MRILFVCAGNLLRSVISECVFEARAGELLGDLSGVFEVESSGLEAEEQGEWSLKRHPDCVRALELIGLPAGLPAPTRTDSEHMARADIAVTMTRQQSYVMANRFPENKRKCFSLLEVNGALWTLSEGRPAVLEEGELSRLAVETGEDGLRKGLDRVAESLTGTSRELLMPLEGVRLNVRELMTLFAPCFYQVSGVHDPMGGTDEEISRCARQLDGEVSRMLHGLVTLAL